MSEISKTNVTLSVLRLYSRDESVSRRQHLQLHFFMENGTMFLGSASINAECFALNIEKKNPTSTAINKRLPVFFLQHPLQGENRCNGAT